MASIRTDLIDRIWRGKDPLLEHPRGLIQTDPQGWNSRHDYMVNAIARLAPKIVIDLGVWKGGSTIFMAQNMKERGQAGVVIAVDTWLGSAAHWPSDLLPLMWGYPALYHVFAANVLAAGVADHVVPLPLDSLNAAELLHRLGVRPALIHLDGAHDYAAVLADLHAWWPLLAPGGELIGDDYAMEGGGEGVKRAFDTFFGRTLENQQAKCRVTKDA